MHNPNRMADAMILREQTKVLKTARLLLRHLKPETRRQLARALDTGIAEDAQILIDFHRLLGDSTSSIRMVAAISRVSVTVSGLLAQRRLGRLVAVLSGDTLKENKTGKVLPPDYMAYRIASRCRVSVECGADIWHVIAHQLTHGTIDLPGVTRTKTPNGKIHLSL